MDTNRSPAPNLSSSGRQPMLTELTRYAFERESEADELNERLVIVIENARALAGDQLCQHAQEQLDPYRDLKAERDDFLYQANRFRLAIAISLAGSGAFEQAIDMLSFVASNLDIVSGIKVRQIRKNKLVNSDIVTIEPVPERLVYLLLGLKHRLDQLNKRATADEKYLKNVHERISQLEKKAGGLGQRVLDQAVEFDTVCVEFESVLDDALYTRIETNQVDQIKQEVVGFIRQLPPGIAITEIYHRFDGNDSLIADPSQESDHATSPLWTAAPRSVQILSPKPINIRVKVDAIRIVNKSSADQADFLNSFQSQLHKAIASRSDLSWESLQVGLVLTFAPTDILQRQIGIGTKLSGEINRLIGNLEPFSIAIFKDYIKVAHLDEGVDIEAYPYIQVPAN